MPCINFRHVDLPGTGPGLARDMGCRARGDHLLTQRADGETELWLAKVERTCGGPRLAEDGARVVGSDSERGCEKRIRRGTNPGAVGGGLLYSVCAREPLGKTGGPCD